MANNRWIQQGSATTPSGAQYGDDVILKNGSFFVVDENGDLVGLMPKNGGTFTGLIHANGGIDLPEDITVSWANGWRIYADSGTAFYMAPLSGYNTYLMYGISQGAWSFLPSGTVTLGNANYKWGQIYSTNATISTSDLNDKKDIVLMTAEQARPFLMALRPRLFKFIDGTSGRTHYGLIAQEVEEAMQECGISDMEFAGFIRSPKTERIRAGEDENGAPVFEERIVEGEYVYGLRYEEFIAPMIATIQEQQRTIDRLSSLLVEKGILTQEEIDELGE